MKGLLDKILTRKKDEEAFGETPNAATGTSLRQVSARQEIALPSSRGAP
jgi:hypothetical protein